MQASSHRAARSWNLVGKRLAVGPDGSVRKVIFLPDRDGLLQGIDHPAAGVKGSRAVSRGHDNENTGIADLKAAETMKDGNIPDLKARTRFLRGAPHVLRCHRVLSLL